MTIESHGRRLRKLRVQLIDACNFRCVYCMPKNPTFLPAHKLLKHDEMADICGRLIALGVDEIRLTGGEPLLYPEFGELVESLSKLKLKKLGLTTNGFHLLSFLPRLQDSALRHINVSLDSLDPEKFYKATRRKALHEVMESILQAHAMGFAVKVNAVAMRGINDDEIFDFMNFSRRTGISVRFLELMKIGPQQENFAKYFISMDEMVEKISLRHGMRPVAVPADNTAREFVLDNGARVGFIASESKSFCGNCSRLRLTATGGLRPCLFMDREVNLRGLSGAAFEEAVHRVAAMKPTERIEKIAQPMYAIGG